MFKYTHAEKMNALRMLEEVGPARTKEATGIPATTLYRWKKLQEQQVTDDQPDDMDFSLDEHEADESNAEPIQPALVPVVTPEAEQSDELDVEALLESMVASFKEENKNLRNENEHLRHENDKYRRMLLIAIER